MPAPTTARLLAPNTRIGGKYVLVRRLAAGGMGDVWLARNEGTEAHVALKVLRPNPDERTQTEERFRREARLGGLLAHRSVVRIFDFLEEPDGSLVLVMELLRGETLERWIEKRGAFPMREAMAVIASVLSALQHGHDHGVVHRDVKPSNILLDVDPDGRVIPKLVDFGIAKMPRNDTSKTMDGVVLGTPSYMSPEQIRAEPDIDGRSDLFSAAVVLYEMLTATCPFEAPTPSAAIASVLQSAVDPDPRIDPRLWLELARALSKRPKERHASANAMLTAMLSAIGETEDSLGSVLRTEPPRDYLANLTGPHSARAAVLEAQTQSVEGQSVGEDPPRRGGAWVPLLGVGALAASIAVVAVMTLSHGAPHAIAPQTTGVAVTQANANAAAPLASNQAAGTSVLTPALPVTTPPSPALHGNDAASTNADVIAPPMAPLNTPAPSPPTHPAPHTSHATAPKPHTPRPIATSPGF